MRTARTLTVSRTMVCRGVYLVPAKGGVLSPSQGGVLSLIQGGVLSPSQGGAHSPSQVGCLPGGVYLVPGETLSQGGGMCVCLGGVPGPRGVSAWGVYLVQGGCLPRGVSAQGGVCPGRVSAGGFLPRGCTWSGTPPLWTEWHASENITLPQTSFAGGN